MKSINDFLDSDEKIVWQGRPNYLVWTLSKILIPSIILLPVFSLLLYGLLIKKAFVLIVFLIFISFFMFWLIWEYFIILSKKGFPNYYITSKSKVIILSELGGLKSPFMPYEIVFSRGNITNTYNKQNVFEKLFGNNCKTIKFKLAFQPKRTIRQMELPPELKGKSKEEIMQALASGSYNGFNVNLKTNLNLDEQSIAFAQLGNEISFVSMNNYEQILSTINNNKVRMKKADWESKSSFKGVLSYALIKDFVRFFRFVLYSTIIVGCLAAMIYVLARSPELFMKIISFYLPKLLMIILGIFIITSFTPKVIFRWISPKYEIMDNSLRLQPRSLKIITDVPFEEIDLGKIKQIWRLNVFGDKNYTYLLGIQLDSLGHSKFLKKDNFIKKSLKMWSEALTFRIILSIPNSDEFLNKIKVKPQELNQSFFEKIIFYASFL